MKGYISEVCASLMVILTGLIWKQSTKNDVPDSTKDFVRDEIKDHELEEDKNRAERAKKYHAELSLKLSETVELALDKHETRMQKENDLKDQLVLKDVRFLSKQFSDVHEEVKKITENCEYHKKKKR